MINRCSSKRNTAYWKCATGACLQFFLKKRAAVADESIHFSLTVSALLFLLINVVWLFLACSMTFIWRPTNLSSVFWGELSHCQQPPCPHMRLRTAINCSNNLSLGSSRQVWESTTITCKKNAKEGAKPQCDWTHICRFLPVCISVDLSVCSGSHSLNSVNKEVTLAVNKQILLSLSVRVSTTTTVLIKTLTDKSHVL